MNPRNFPEHSSRFPSQAVAHSGENPLLWLSPLQRYCFLFTTSLSSCHSCRDYRKLWKDLTVFWWFLQRTPCTNLHKEAIIRLCCGFWKVFIFYYICLFSHILTPKHNKTKLKKTGKMKELQGQVLRNMLTRH